MLTLGPSYPDIVTVELAMKLILKRTQRSAGMLGNKVAFGLNARVDLTPEERSNISKYRLGGEVVYNSEARRKSGETLMAASQGQVGLIRGFAALAAGSLALKCTIDSLAAGQYIECKDLPELLGAEEAVREGCQIIKSYLETAATFDGREEVVEI